jgi:alpha-1,3-fucosyltransferase 10
MPSAKRPVVLFFNGFWRERTPGGLSADHPLVEFSADAARLGEAQAVVFHLPTLRPRADLPKYPGQIWVAWSMESEVFYPRLDDPVLKPHFDLEMSHRRQADVWMPYLPAAQAAALRRAPGPKPEAAPAVLLVSNPVERNGRNRLAAELMKRVRIDSFGAVLDNRRFASDSNPRDPGARRAAKLALFSRYKFVLAFENAVSPGYVTEKF